MYILKNRTTKNLITVAVYLLIIVFVALNIRTLDFSKFKEIDIDWLYVVAAIPASVLARVFLPYIWITLIRIYEKVDGSNEYWHLNYIYAKSWLGRYIPGKVAWVGGKIYFALERGFSKTVLGITSIVEAGLQLLTALLLGDIFLLVSGAYSGFSTTYIIFFLGASIAGTVALMPPVFNRIIALGYRLVKKKPLDKKYYIKLPDLLRVGAMYVGAQALTILPIYFLVRALGFELSFAQLLFVSGAFIFAGAVGTLAIVAPSGLGVREGVILLFLVNILPTEISVVLVIALRIWSVFLDLLYWILSYLVVRMLKQYRVN